MALADLILFCWYVDYVGLGDSEWGWTLDVDSQYIAFFRDAVDLDLADFDTVGPTNPCSSFAVGQEVDVDAIQGQYSGFVSAIASNWLMVHDGTNERIVCPTNAKHADSASESNTAKSPWRKRVLNFS